MVQKSKVAVIGVGNIGTVVATNLIKANRSIIVADRKIEKANKLSEKLGNLAQSKEVAVAIKEADIIVLAILFDGIKEFLNCFANSSALVTAPAIPR